MDKKLLRDRLQLFSSVAFCFLYVPHLLLYACKRNVRQEVNADLDRWKEKSALRMGHTMMLVYHLHTCRYFRNLFYHRAGPIIGSIIGWYRPGDRYFVISKGTKIGAGAYFVHPFASEINAKSIGRNFSCRHLTTLGNKKDGDNDRLPVIGNDVTLGVNVTIIGDVVIGDNVVIGAGSVVVKDIPSNSVAVGNPCQVIKTRNKETT